MKLFDARFLQNFPAMTPKTRGKCLRRYGNYFSRKTRFHARSKHENSG